MPNDGRCLDALGGGFVAVGHGCGALRAHLDGGPRALTVESLGAEWHSYLGVHAIPPPFSSSPVVFRPFEPTGVAAVRREPAWIHG